VDQRGNVNPDSPAYHPYNRKKRTGPLLGGPVPFFQVLYNEPREAAKVLHGIGCEMPSMTIDKSTDCYGVIWDVDGTLVDTAELHFAAWQRLARERSLPFTRADFEATFGRRNPEILRELFGSHLSDAQVAEYGDRKEIHYREEAARGVQLLPGVRELLQGAQTAGFLQAVGSSAPRANLELILHLTDTAAFFAAVVSMEDTTRGKPDPRVFQVAAARLGLQPRQCVVIEDAVAGVQAARAGGMKCIAVTFVGHHSEDNLRAAGADLVVKNLEVVDADALKSLLPPGQRSEHSMG
jgi:beta-phosphoglucomutase